MKLKAFRLGHAVGRIHNHGATVKRQSQNTTCATGGLFIAPTADKVVNNNDPFDIKWDTTCMTTSAIDIYLYTSGTNQTLLHVWQSVGYAAGTYTTALRPKWWNSTADTNVQLAIVPAKTPIFMRTYPAGNVFRAHYDAPADGKIPPYADTTKPDALIETASNNPSASGKHVSKGGIAAAILVPLIVIGIIIGIYVRFQRQRRTDKTKRWSEAVDKRMSTIAPDWNAITPGGATQAVRSSIAASRMSYAFGRPSSTFATEGGHAGAGAPGYVADDMAYGYNPQMAQQYRPTSSYSVSTAARTSRISFAADTRPPRGYQPAYVPPVPELPRKNSDDLVTSPTQTAGPLSLTPDDIRARVSGSERSSRPSIEEVMPALSMMRTGITSDSRTGNDMLLSPPAPPAPVVAPAPPKSPVGHMPMGEQTLTYMSPDDMLRQYAAQRSPGGPVFPSPSYSGSSMRVLYSPSSSTPTELSENRKSFARSVASQYSDGDAYAGMGA